MIARHRCAATGGCGDLSRRSRGRGCCLGAPQGAGRCPVLAAGYRVGRRCRGGALSGCAGHLGGVRRMGRSVLVEPPGAAGRADCGYSRHVPVGGVRSIPAPQGGAGPGVDLAAPHGLVLGPGVLSRIEAARSRRETAPDDKARRCSSGVVYDISLLFPCVPLSLVLADPYAGVEWGNEGGDKNKGPTTVAGYLSNKGRRHRLWQRYRRQARTRPIYPALGHTWAAASDPIRRVAGDAVLPSLPHLRHRPSGLARQGRRHPRGGETTSVINPRLASVTLPPPASLNSV